VNLRRFDLLLLVLFVVPTLGAVCGNDPRDCHPACFTWQTCESTSGTCVQARCVVADDCGPHTTCDGSGRCQPIPCTSDAECDDGLWCTGVETCAAASADSPRGCRAGTPRCASGVVCSEAYRVCGTCAEAGDVDGDGVRSVQCGGADCDDHDPDRYPGNPERCVGTLRDGGSLADHDEDCNPCTVSSAVFDDGDQDLDGFPSASCTNSWTGSGPPGCDLNRVSVAAHLVAGRDCDDGNANVHPDQPEVCNHVDDNCDGVVDEGVTVAAYPDNDGDGVGAAGFATTPKCPQDLGNGWEAEGNDCNDKNAAIVPGSIICGASANAIVTCQSDGGWLDGLCSTPQQICHAQPNGTGVCL